MKKYKKLLKRFSLAILGLILTLLLFPTWTPKIKGEIVLAYMSKF